MKLFRFGLPISLLSVLTLATTVSLCTLGCGGGSDGTPNLEDEETRQKFAADSKTKLKQLAFGLQMYHDANGSYPPACTLTADGKPGLSWRVLILPYLDQGSLYEQFKLNEPWDSPHNQALLKHIPPQFQSPYQKGEPTSTFYQVVVGPQTLFEPVEQLQRKTRSTPGVPVREVTDGTVHTLLVVEAGRSVPWSKPEDLAYTRGGALPDLGGLFPDRFYYATANGSVGVSKKPGNTNQLPNLFMRNDGMPVTLDNFGMN